MTYEHDFGSLRADFGALWGGFGSLWDYLGSHSGRFGLTLGLAWTYEGDFRSILDYFWITLVHLGHTFGTLWGHFGTTSGSLGA